MEDKKQSRDYMWKHKAKVTFKSLIVYITLLFLWPLFIQLFTPNLMKEGFMFEDILSSVFLFTLFGVPIILATALPVTILAGFVTKYFKGFSRLAINFILHIGSAILISQFLFEGTKQLVSIAIVVAAAFFTFDELPYFPKKREKGIFFGALVLILLLTLVPTWTKNYQVSQELKEIDQAGFPTPIIMMNEKEVVIHHSIERYTSSEEGAIYDRLEPYILPLGILEDSQYDVFEMIRGDSLSLKFDQELNDYTVELAYLLDGSVVTEKISDTNNEFVFPDNLEPQAIAIDVVWPRHQVSFQIMVK